MKQLAAALQVRVLRAMIGSYASSYRTGSCNLGAYAACADVDDFLETLEEGPLATVASQAAGMLRRLGHPERPLTGSLTLTLPIEQVEALARLAPAVEPPETPAAATDGQASGAEGTDPVQVLASHLRLLVDYARWQMNEGPGHHPTLPSAIAGASTYLRQIGLDRPNPMTLKAR